MSSKTSTDPGFVHLHVHSEYSILDGMVKIPDAIAVAVEQGAPAFALTDHGSLSGAWKLAKAAHAAGIKPIIGLEAYVALGSRHERNEILVENGDDSGVDDDAEQVGKAGGKAKAKRYEHITLLAKNAAGWKNLVMLSDYAEDSYWYKPRIDWDLLRRHSDGLIILTGCLGGPVLGPASRGDLTTAAANLDMLIDIVGRDHVFVEVMEHGIESESAALPAVAKLAKAAGVKMVATNDAHYTRASDARAHEAWLARQSKTTLSDPRRYHFHGEGYHLRSREEMLALRPEKWWVKAVDNTVLVADMIDSHVLPESRPRLPKFKVPKEFDSARQYFIHLVSNGAKERLGVDELPQKVRDRLNTELKVIEANGVIDYFLIMWDLASWCHSEGINTGPGRGSAAGCFSSYALGIVDVDPLENGLLFERFLEMGRGNLPDIDYDVEVGRRDEVLAYLASKYGVLNVAHIGTYGNSRTKDALKSAAKTLGLGSVGERLAKLVPDFTTLAQLLDDQNRQHEPFRSQIRKEGDDGEQVLYLAKAFEGTSTNEGVHACGIIISTVPLNEIIPLRRKRSSASKISVGEDTALAAVTQWDGTDLEEMGLLKLDILGIRNLDVVATALNYIADTTGEKISVAEIPHPNTKGDERVAKTFALLQAGKTAGVFQMESGGMQRTAQNVKPQTLEDLSAVIALFRPGPLSAGMDETYARRKAGVEDVDYSTFTPVKPEQKAIATVLAETYGVWVYQEQLMRLGTVIAGFDAGLRGKLRKAVGKKIPAVMAEVGEKLIEGAPQEFRDEHGELVSMVFKVSTAERVFDQMKGSAEYLFNKSHSVAYAMLAYYTAFLKANWPAQFGAALLAVPASDEKRFEALRALEQEGITVLPPDVNHSGAVTKPEGDAVRLGLSEVKGIGKAGVALVERRQGSPFRSLGDFMLRVVPQENRALNTGAIESLIEAGALDCFGERRMGMMMAIAALAHRPNLPVPDLEWGILESSARQRVKLGVSLGTHPLSAFKDAIRDFDPLKVAGKYATEGSKLIPLHQLDDDDDIVYTAGILSGWGLKDYSGGRFARVEIEGSRGRIGGVMWSNQLERLTDADAVPDIGEIVAVKAKVRIRQIEVEQPDGTVEITNVRELNILSLDRIPVEDELTGSYSPKGPKVKVSRHLFAVPELTADDDHGDDHRGESHVTKHQKRESKRQAPLEAPTAKKSEPEPREKRSMLLARQVPTPDSVPAPVPISSARKSAPVIEEDSTLPPVPGSFTSMWGNRRRPA